MSTQSKFNALELLARIRTANAASSSQSKSYYPNNDGNLVTPNPDSSNFRNMGKSATPIKQINTTDTNSYQQDSAIKAKEAIRNRENFSRSIDAFRDVPSPNVIPFSFDDTRREEGYSAKRKEKIESFEYFNQLDSPYGSRAYSSQKASQHVHQNIPHNRFQNQNQNQNQSDYESSNINSRREFEDFQHNDKNIPEPSRTFKDTYESEENYVNGDYDSIFHSAQNHGFDQSTSDYQTNSGFYSNNNLQNINEKRHRSDNSNNISNNSSNNKQNNKYSESPISDESFGAANNQNLNHCREIKRNFNSNRDFESSNSADIIIKNSPFTEELYNELHKLKLENNSLSKSNKKLQIQKSEIEKIALENKIKNDDLVASLRGK